MLVCASYSAKAVGSIGEEKLTKPDIQNRIRELQTERQLTTNQPKAFAFLIMHFHAVWNFRSLDRASTVRPYSPDYSYL